MTQEALKLALEALCTCGPQQKQAITAIKEALANHIPDATKMVAQPEQEPACCNGNCPNTKDCEQAMQCLYTTPPQRTWERPWVALTDEERKNIMIECESTGDWAWELKAAQAIEAKLKEKNT